MIPDILSDVMPSVPLSIQCIFQVVLFQAAWGTLHNIVIEALDPSKEMANPPGLLSLMSVDALPDILHHQYAQVDSLYKQNLHYDANCAFMCLWLVCFLKFAPFRIAATMADLHSAGPTIDGEAWSTHLNNPIVIGTTVIFIAEIVGRCQRKETLKTVEATLRWIWIVAPVSAAVAAYCAIENQGCAVMFYAALLLVRYTSDSIKAVVRILCNFYCDAEEPTSEAPAKGKKSNGSAKGEGSHMSVFRAVVQLIVGLSVLPSTVALLAALAARCPSRD